MLLRSLQILFFISISFSINAQQGKGRNKGQQPNKKASIVTIKERINVVLGSPTENSIAFNIISPNDAIVNIEYDTNDHSFKHRTNSFELHAEEPTEILLENLISNENYFYRINYHFKGNTNDTTSEIGNFSTRKQKGNTFSFGVQGDSHPEREGKMFNPELYKITLDSVKLKRPDFYFMLGDDFSLDRLMNRNELEKRSVESIYLTQRYYLGNIGKNPPLFLVNGNHEQAAKYLLNGQADNFAVFAANARKKYFPLPAPSGMYTGDKDNIEHIGLLKDYYSFEWGDALFIVLDPYWHSNIPVDNVPNSEQKKEKKQPWDITLGQEQYFWFQKTLETSTAKYKFVFAHHVSGTGRGGIERAKYFEWGGYSQRDIFEFKKYRPDWSLPIHQLMVKNNVTIFFQGHDHLFAKQELDGVIYQSVPNPADDTYTAFNMEAYTSGIILPNSGFLNITVSPQNVKVEYVKSFLPSKILPQNFDQQNFLYTIK